jgi:hypothetical protein
MKVASTMQALPNNGQVSHARAKQRREFPPYFLRQLTSAHVLWPQDAQRLLSKQADTPPSPSFQQAQLPVPFSAGAPPGDNHPRQARLKMEMNLYIQTNGMTVLPSRKKKPWYPWKKLIDDEVARGSTFVEAAAHVEAMRVDPNGTKSASAGTTTIRKGDGEEEEEESDDEGELLAITNSSREKRGTEAPGDVTSSDDDKLGPAPSSEEVRQQLLEREKGYREETVGHFLGIRTRKETALTQANKEFEVRNADLCSTEERLKAAQADLVTAGSLSDTAKKEKVAAEVEARRTMLVHGDAFERDKTAVLQLECVEEMIQNAKSAIVDEFCDPELKAQTQDYLNKLIAKKKGLTGNAELTNTEESQTSAAAHHAVQVKNIASDHVVAADAQVSAAQSNLDNIFAELNEKQKLVEYAAAERDAAERALDCAGEDLCFSNSQLDAFVARYFSTEAAPIAVDAALATPAPQRTDDPVAGDGNLLANVEPMPVAEPMADAEPAHTVDQMAGSEPMDD